MGYLYLLCVALMFSFGGTCVKIISPYFGPEYITFFRFLFGVLFLLLLKAWKKDHFPKNFRELLMQNWRWILFGGVAKWLAYFTENYALTHGLSYGNIVTQPVQVIFITLSSVILFKDKLSLRQIFCIFLCISGVLCISLNGRPVSVFLEGNVFLMILFIISGICAGSHVLSQKMIGDKMDIIDSNLAIFTISSFFSLLPTIPSTLAGHLAGVRPTISCIIAIVAFGGLITGLGFYLNAKALKLVPFYMVPVIQSTMAIFAITWGVLFFQESITIYIVGGTATFIVGLIGLQLKSQKGHK